MYILDMGMKTLNFKLDLTDGYRDQMWVTLGHPQTFLKKSEKKTGGTKKKFWEYIKKISVGTKKKFWG